MQLEIGTPKIDTPKTYESTYEITTYETSLIMPRTFIWVKS